MEQDRHAAGPHKLLRTVSQKLRSFLLSSADSGARTGSNANLFIRREHLGECGWKITPVLHPLQQSGEEMPGNLGRKHRSSSRWRFRFSVGRDYSQNFQGTVPVSQKLDVEEDSDDGCNKSTGLGCFGFESKRSRSMREDENHRGNQLNRSCCFGPITRSGAEVDDEAAKGEESIQAEVSLPDEILEMCLARVPFDSLVRARTVCKKWRSITLTAHFLQLREKIFTQKPWLFIFGISRDGVCVGEVQALDPTSDKWHSIKAERLSGRILYSSAAIASKVYVVGGCSARTDSTNKSGVLKTHRSVLLMDALTGQWKKVAGMKHPRTTPVVGVFEITDWKKLAEGSSSDVSGHRNRRQHKEIGVYRGLSTSASRQLKLMEIMGRRCMQRGCGPVQSSNNNREVWNAYQELLRSTRSPSTVTGPGPGGESSGSSSTSSCSWKKRYGLIVVGGQGEWNQTLNSGEIYDPDSDSWKEIAAWPVEFGVICTGVVCRRFFYGYSDTDRLVAYDFEQDTWCGICTSYVPARLQEYLPKLVVVNGRVVLVGVAWGVGEEEESGKAARKMWRLEEDHEAGSECWRWGEVSEHPDAPLDSNAVFVAHKERIYGVEMFRIFGQVLDFVTVCDLGSGRGRWERVSKRRLGLDMDASSCLTKTAVVVEL